MLILRPKRDVVVKPNPNEVQATKWVTPEELEAMFEQAKASGTKIAPWFEMISRKFLLPTWWGNLDNVTAMRDDKIHKLAL